MERKINYINDYLKKHKIDILALLETHTYATDMNWLKSAFPDYIVWCEGENKNSYFRSYKQKTEQDIMKQNLPEAETEELLGAVNEYNALYAGGVIVLIKKDIINNFERSYFIPDKRGIR